jgi:hypothetical protein
MNANEKTAGKPTTALAVRKTFIRDNLSGHLRNEFHGNDVP